MHILDTLVTRSATLTVDQDLSTRFAKFAKYKRGVFIERVNEELC